jgi:hypothetical protein
MLGAAQCPADIAVAIFRLNVYWLVVLGLVYGRGNGQSRKAGYYPIGNECMFKEKGAMKEFI